MTLNPNFMKYSAEKDPLYPVLKFSTVLTVFFSNGTLVPPDVTKTIGKLSFLVYDINASILSLVFTSINN